MADEIWSEDEFAAAVEAYLGMLDDEQAGRPSNRAEIRRRLIAGPLSRRTAAAVEYRMQNISAVLDEEGRGYLSGYLPARQVGPRGTRIIKALLDRQPAPIDDQPGTAALPGSSSQIAIDGDRAPRIYLTGMWGFNPELEGYVGFSRSATRDRLLRDYQPGDLMVIVGQASAFSSTKDVGRLLGLVELDPRPIDDAERMSTETYRRKLEQFGPDRWKFALPIKRAWRMGREIVASGYIAQSYSHRNAQFVGANFVLLSDAEAAKILALPVRAISIWGEQDWSPGSQNAGGERRASEATRRGPPPSYGTSTVHRTDGDNHLYLMRMTGCVDALFPELMPGQTRKAIIKVGRSNEPARRVEEMNAGFPPDAAASWKLIQTKKFSCGADAHKAETGVLDALKAKGRHIGGEFGWVPEKELDTVLAPHIEAAVFVMRS